MKKSLYPKTAKQALDKFEKGECLIAVELGGIGPGYEQAIWNGIFKMIRAYHTEDIDNWIEGNRFSREVDEKLSIVCKGDGLSGAQAQAIKMTAYQVMKYGWRHMIEKAPEDRRITISRDFPEYK